MSTAVDPKQINGEQKSQLQLIPSSAMWQCADVLQLGASKYGAWNWRDSRVLSSTYVGAILRHLYRWCDSDDGIDEESGVSHLAHIMATCAILLDAEEHDQLEKNMPDQKERT